MSFWKWKKSPALNGTADPTCPFPEGMAPGAVNDGVRGAMAALAKYRDDVSGILSPGGTPNALTVATNQGFDTLANMDGATISFVMNGSNTTAVTLIVDGLGGALPVKSATGVDLGPGSLLNGSVYTVTYLHSASIFLLRDFSNVPIGCGMEFWGASPPPGFVFPVGQAISRASFPACFAVLSTIHGAGDGSTTFNLPDKRGRYSVVADGGAGRFGNFMGATLGAVGGQDFTNLVTANLPAYTPSGSVSVVDGPITSFPNFNHMSSTAAGGNFLSLSNTGGTVDFVVPASQSGTTASFFGNAQGGSSTAIPRVPPTIVCNYILRVI